MEAIIGCLFGIFVGMATAGYMYIGECAKKENKISEYEEENKTIREELEDVKFDLSTAYKEIEQKDEIVGKMKIVINDFMTKEDKLNKINELVKIYEDIN